MSEALFFKDQPELNKKLAVAECVDNAKAFAEAGNRLLYQDYAAAAELLLRSAELLALAVERQAELLGAH